MCDDGAETIESAAEFVRLRTSTNPEEYHQAAHGTASEAVWRTIIAEYPEMRVWVVQNKTIPLSILKELMHDPDWRVRLMVARKRKADEALLSGLAHDPDDGVRMSVARHPRTPEAVLCHLMDDPWDAIVAVVRERLGNQGDTQG